MNTRDRDVEGKEGILIRNKITAKFDGGTDLGQKYSEERAENRTTLPMPNSTKEQVVVRDIAEITFLILPSYSTVIYDTTGHARKLDHGDALVL